MTSRLTAAMEEGYASAPVGVMTIETLELAHPSLATPIRVATGVETPVVARLTAGGMLATFEPCAFSYTPPAQSEGGIEPAEIAIDAVGGLLISALDSLVADDNPITVTYRAYRIDDLDAPGEGPITGFEIRNVQSDGVRTTAELVFPDVSTTAFPGVTYDLATYPGLHML